MPYKKNKKAYCLVDFLVEATGLEPVTPCL